MKMRPYRSRPDISAGKLDFSGFHPTDDHWPWQCGDLPGGWRTHVRYAWTSKHKNTVRAATLCKVGRHRPAQAWKRDNLATDKWETWMCCGDCAKKLTEPQPE